MDPPHQRGFDNQPPEQISAREATRLLGEVHTLARAYHWREAEILAMSSRRRQAYLELAGV